jgi:SpoVK/Ycf46/Vps4 family AAA+-type ATPase
MAPCVRFADEIEKALAGATSSSQTDSGVTARVFGSLLTWLNDHESDVFFVATCNDASKLPPEFARAERFDGVFFIDLPGRDQKDATWGIYTGHYGLDAKQGQSDDTTWTGVESAARSGRAERRTRGCPCGGQDRGVTPAGLWSVPVG